jgi:hypothetical protein
MTAKTDLKICYEVKQLRGKGKSVRGIQTALELQGISLGLGTISNILKREYDISEEVQERFRPVQWHELEHQGYSLEDVRYMLDLWAWTKGQVIPTQGQAYWLARLRRLAPGMDVREARYIAVALDSCDEGRKRGMEVHDTNIWIHIALKGYGKGAPWPSDWGEGVKLPGSPGPARLTLDFGEDYPVPESPDSRLAERPVGLTDQEGHLVQCYTCGREILVRIILAEVSHSSLVIARCWECLDREAKQRAISQYDLQIEAV